jgi:ABC-type sugar transport system ATPase subunit
VPKLVLRGVRKRFEGEARDAVSAMDLEVAEGELLVLVGPSGCGKTTTLRIVAGLEEPSEGEVWIGGRRVDGVAPRDRDVAVVFQNYALYPHMSVFDNMAFGLRMRGTPRAEVRARVEQAAALLGIGELLARRPAQLSGGQRQRVAMGRAIVRKPQLFLFDEPLSNLDAKLRAQMRTEIKRLHQRLRATTVYVTHDQVEAMTLATRIVVMNAGRIEQIGVPAELYTRPATRFVAGFIGTPSRTAPGSPSSSARRASPCRRCWSPPTAPMPGASSSSACAPSTSPSALRARRPARRSLWKWTSSSRRASTRSRSGASARTSSARACPQRPPRARAPGSSSPRT